MKLTTISYLKIVFLFIFSVQTKATAVETVFEDGSRYSAEIYCMTENAFAENRPCTSEMFIVQSSHSEISHAVCYKGDSNEVYRLAKKAIELGFWTWSTHGRQQYISMVRNFGEVIELAWVDDLYLLSGSTLLLHCPY